jgi:hypothetical protein
MLMKRDAKKKMVKLEMFQKDDKSFISFRVLIPQHEAGQVLAYIGSLKNVVPLKPKKNETS